MLQCNCGNIGSEISERSAEHQTIICGRQGAEYVRRMARHPDVSLSEPLKLLDQIRHARYLPGDDETVEMLNDHVDSISVNHVGTEMCRVAHL